MAHFKNKKIGVLLGGLSSEREISLRSGEAVYQALVRLGYDVVKIDVGREAAVQLKTAGIEIAFLALHGRWGEDGVMQGLLEMMGIPYTGSGVLASSLAMDKYLTKEVLLNEGIPLPAHRFLDAQSNTVEAFVKTFDLKFPVIVKPSREGSTLGIEIVQDKANLSDALRRGLKYDHRLLVESFIKGVEVTVAILNGKPLPIIEVVPQSGFYDFEAKYTQGKTEYLIPARISATMVTQLQAYSLKSYYKLGCEGVARADFIIHEATPYFLEINTLPGMTATSLVPKAAFAMGMSFEALVESILETAKLKNS